MRLAVDDIKVLPFVYHKAVKYFSRVEKKKVKEKGVYLALRARQSAKLPE